MKRQEALERFIKGEKIARSIRPTGYAYLKDGFKPTYTELGIEGEPIVSFFFDDDGYEIYKEPIPDKAPILCWDSGVLQGKEIRFYDAKNKRTYNRISGKRSGYMHDNYQQIPEETMDTLWPDWREAQAKLEDKID